MQVERIPSWMETNSRSPVDPPVTTRKQYLPFQELIWEDFEMLCLRLSRTENPVEKCRLYGDRGEKQGGIDLYSEPGVDGKHVVYQCKRVKQFGPAKITAAVDEFTKGEWVDKTSRFVLCTMESLGCTLRTKRVEVECQTLSAKGIKFDIWDADELGQMLKGKPKLVDDFFGREWVKLFCGKEAADQLGTRLDAKMVREFRRLFGRLYESIAHAQDPGLPVLQLDPSHVLVVRRRYVIPDVFLQREAENRTERDEQQRVPPAEPEARSNQEGYMPSIGSRSSRGRSTVAYQQRLNVEGWLGSIRRGIILGEPGSGKSTLLRFIGLDLLSDSPRLETLARKWGQYLPVWVPFALWTKMLTETNTSECSLIELLQSWLRRHSEDRLLPIMGQAFTDERLLLLVDGLDEWTSEPAGRIAVQKLQVFVETRDVPVLVTSRPHGFRKLSMGQEGWDLCQLAPLSASQQTELCNIWFRHWAQSSNGPTSTDSLQKRALSDAAAFVSELRDASDLRELAEVPLLLYALIALRFSNLRLPRNRFSAYKSLVDLLVAEHPRRRRQAAHITEGPYDLQPEELRSILAFLAYYMFEEYGEGHIEAGEAARALELYLRDPERGLGLEPPKARTTARNVISLAQDVLGLIVRKSTDDIGFFHRVLQEFLASIHLSCLEFDTQCDVVSQRATDPQWHEVLLGLLHHTRRTSETAAFVECIRRAAPNTVERLRTDLLLAEAAFGDFNLSPSLSRELAEQVLIQVEDGIWIPHRERLLNIALQGLRSGPTKDLLKARLQRWFPRRLGWSRQYVLRNMTRWPKSSEVAEVLLRTLTDEDYWCRRAVAEALVNLWKGDDSVGSEIERSAVRSIDPVTRAVALDALLSGWPSSPRLEEIITNSRNSLCPELRITAIKGKVQRGTQDEKDLKAALYLTTWESGLGYQWKDDVVDIILRGWPGSGTIKADCLHSLSRVIDGHQPRIERETAERLLLSGFPNDEEVIEYCAEQIRSKKHPFGSLRWDAWDLIAKNFSINSTLAPVIEDWLGREEHDTPAISNAALALRTDMAKQKLIIALESEAPTPHWLAQALLDGWGMKDEEVAALLRSVVDGPSDRASQIAFLLPRILPSKAECRRRLLELLRDPTSVRLDFVMSGLMSLISDIEHPPVDEEVIAAVLDLRKDSRLDNTIAGDAVVALLVVNFPSDSRVRAIAMEELAKRDGCHEAISFAYGRDEEIRQILLERVTCLPTRLREIIAHRIGEASSESEFSLSLLGEYELEPDAQVKALSSIGYHTLLNRLDKDSSDALQTLTRDIVCYGPNYETRRQAAFCGLVILGRLDVMKNSQERIGNRICSVPLSGGLDHNRPLIQFVLSHWSTLKDAFGEEFYARLSWHDRFDWDVLCLYAADYPPASGDVLAHVITVPPGQAGQEMLYFLERLEPCSEILLTYCLGALHSTPTVDYKPAEKSTAAAEIIGKAFRGDERILARLLDFKPGHGVMERVIVALCEGWPDNQRLRDFYNEVSATRDTRLTYDMYYRVLTRCGDAKRIYESLLSEFQLQDRRHWRHLSSVIRTVLPRRLQTDDELSKALSERLKGRHSSTETVSILRLLSAGKGLTSELSNMATDEIERQLAMEFPEIAFDAYSGELRPVVEALFDCVR